MQVNNAGIAWADSVETFTEARPPGAASGDEHLGVYTGVFDTNFKGPVMLTHFAVPHLAAAKGAVVNVSSIHSFRVVCTALYCTTFLIRIAYHIDHSGQ